MPKRIRVIIFSCAAICLHAVTASAREEERRSFQRVVPLPAGRSFNVDHSLGNVGIRTQAKAEAEIRATIQCSADTAAEARSLCDRIQISVQESARGVEVRTQYPSGEQSERNRGFRVDFDIIIPESAPLEIRNRFGNVALSDLRAPAVINNSNGNVGLVAGRGRQQIENSFGNIVVQGNNGDVVLKNGNGNVVAGDVSGALDISNRFGNIRVTNAGGRLTINSNNANITATNAGAGASIVNSFGPVTVTDAKNNVIVKNQNGAVTVTGVAGTAELETSFDRVTASQIGRGLKVFANNSRIIADTIGENAWVQTTFGSIELRGVKGNAQAYANNTSIRLLGVGGNVDAKTTFNGVTISDADGTISVEGENGSVTVDVKPGQRCQPVSLQTTFAPIRVSLPAGAGYNLNARTSFGRIRSDVEITGVVQGSADSLTGRIGSGGCELRLTGQNTNIDIVRRQ